MDYTTHGEKDGIGNERNDLVAELEADGIEVYDCHTLQTENDYSSGYDEPPNGW